GSDAHLRGGQPNSLSRPHGGPHVADQLVEFLAELSDWFRLLVHHRGAPTGDGQNVAALGEIGLSHCAPSRFGYDGQVCRTGCRWRAAATAGGGWQVWNSPTVGRRCSTTTPRTSARSAASARTPCGPTPRTSATWPPSPTSRPAK